MGAPSSNPSIVRSPEKGAAGCIYWYVHAGRRRQTLFVSGAHRWFSIVNIVWWWMCACECTRFHWCARVCLICVCLQAVSVCVCINPSNNPNEYTNVRTHRSNNIWQTYTSRHTPTEQKKTRAIHLQIGKPQTVYTHLGQFCGKSPPAGHDKCMGDATDVRERPSCESLSTQGLRVVAEGCIRWCARHRAGSESTLLLLAAAAACRMPCDYR